MRVCSTQLSLIIRSDKRFGNGTSNFYSVNDLVGLDAKKVRGAWTMGLLGIDRHKDCHI